MVLNYVNREINVQSLKSWILNSNVQWCLGSTYYFLPLVIKSLKTNNNNLCLKRSVIFLFKEKADVKITEWSHCGLMRQNICLELLFCPNARVLRLENAFTCGSRYKKKVNNESDLGLKLGNFLVYSCYSLMIDHYLRPELY